MIVQGVNMAMADWLEGYNWNFYCTLTAWYPMSMGAVRRKMTLFQEQLTKQFGNTLLFWVAEPFDSKYGYHAHALLAFQVLPEYSKEKHIRLINTTWQKISGGSGNKGYNHTHIKPYQKIVSGEESGGANFYVVKYLNRGNADYDFVGFEGWNEGEPKNELSQPVIAIS
jgi:hypothetical protein